MGSVFPDPEDVGYVRIFCLSLFIELQCYVNFIFWKTYFNYVIMPIPCYPFCGHRTYYFNKEHR